MGRIVISTFSSTYTDNINLWDFRICSLQDNKFIFIGGIYYEWFMVKKPRREIFNVSTRI